MRTPVNHHLGINKPFAFDCTSESPDCTGGTVLLKRLLFLDVIHNKLGTFIPLTIQGLLFYAWELQWWVLHQLSRMDTVHLWDLNEIGFANGVWDIILFVEEHQVSCDFWEIERVICSKINAVPKVICVGSCLLSFSIQNQAFSMSLLNVLIWGMLFSLPFIGT